MSNLSTEILFDRFEIIEILKKDEHASVFLANHIYLSKKIILKILNTERIADNSLVERFKREAKILAQLDHPNIIKVLDFGTNKEYFYISFEYFEGQSLRNLLKKNELTLQQKEQLTIQLFKGLDYAHNNKIIHRDIKPENIFVNTNYHLKIGDFGLALSAEDTLVTQPYSIVGTPSYMSPEQIRGEKLTHKSDLFSAGLVIFEMFTGKNPFVQENINLTINKIMSFNEEELINDLSVLPELYKKIIIRLLRKNPAQRYSSANEVLKELNVTNELQNYINEQSATADIKTVTFTSKKKKTRVIIAIAIVLFIASFFILYTQLHINNNKNTILNNANKTQTAEQQPKEPQKELSNVGDSKIDKPKEKEKESINIPKEDNQNKVIPIVPPATTKPSKLFVDCYPWAEIYIDGVKKDVTPLINPLSLDPGEHTMKLINPDYPPYMALIKIEPNENSYIKVNLDTTLAFLECNVFPWGNLYLNGELKGQTPLRGLIRLFPGKNRITIKNPAYKDIDTTFIAKKGDTLKLFFKFKK
ncbi:serine/threonine-protein kinase [Melioribacteraceae bacterium 4301-Me]|uniref:serine/threonine-protein kinase n=1 Tax=Pyranulibacter aquaticus TaxID=3163344 RepID=UPI0035972B27